MTNALPEVTNNERQTMKRRSFFLAALGVIIAGPLATLTSSEITQASFSLSKFVRSLTPLRAVRALQSIGFCIEGTYLDGLHSPPKQIAGKRCWKEVWIIRHVETGQLRWIAMGYVPHDEKMQELHKWWNTPEGKRVAKRFPDPKDQIAEFMERREASNKCAFSC